QLNKDHNYGSVIDNQMRTLEHAGIVTMATKSKGSRFELPARLSDPSDPAATLDERARSYLHVNCSHCHQFGAGGTADLTLRHDVPIMQTKVLDVRPVQGTFELADARILAPGDPYRSVLFYRLSKLGRGRMPHIGSEIVDEQGTHLIRDW